MTGLEWNYCAVKIGTFASVGRGISYYLVSPRRRLSHDHCHDRSLVCKDVEVYRKGGDEVGAVDGRCSIYKHNSAFGLVRRPSHLTLGLECERH